MVLPGVLDGAPSRRIAARQRARPPGRLHRTLASGPAPAGARVLPAKGNTGAHDLVKVSTAAYFREFKAKARGMPGLTPEVRSGRRCFPPNLAAHASRALWRGFY